MNSRQVTRLLQEVALEAHAKLIKASALRLQAELRIGKSNEMIDGRLAHGRGGEPASTEKQVKLVNCLRSR